jgi:hypothetical protein
MEPASRSQDKKLDVSKTIDEAVELEEQTSPRTDKGVEVRVRGWTLARRKVIGKGGR